MLSTTTMKIKIRKNIFQEALQLVVNISPKATSEPIINNVLLETEGENQIQVKATNYDNSFLGKFEVEVLKEGSICINTSKLFNLVREFHDEYILLDVTEQNWVHLTCGKSNVKLPGVEPDLFPAIEFDELESSFQIPASFFKTAIDRTYFAIGENESRKNLMGLNLKTNSEDQISWCGADSFRISQYITNLEQPIGTSGNIIIPKKSLSEIKRILDFRDDLVDISFDSNTFQVFSQQIKFKTRLIEANFPNLDPLVSKVGPILLRVSRRELINAIRILYRVSDEDPNSVLKITLDENKLVVESQKMEFGEGQDEIPCDYTGQKMSIGLNIKFFLESLSAFDSASDDLLTINLSGELAPFALQCDEWDNFKTILMPVKIKW